MLWASVSSQVLSMPWSFKGPFWLQPARSIWAVPRDVSCSGRLVLSLQMGWPCLSWVKWHLVGVGMALLAKTNIAKKADDIQEELFLQLEAASFILLDAEQ